MKLSTVVILASLGSASAFMAPASKFSSSLQLASEIAPESLEAMEEVKTPKEPALPDMSQSLPFMARPAVLDGTLAGDVGFDPLGFAKNSDDLMRFREAEVKHARLAMLAAAGWPISELFDAKIAHLVGMTPVLDSADRAPSLLNGGLEKISPLYWIACIAGAAAIDLYGITNASKKSGYTPGNFGFDPLGIFPKDKEGQKRMELAEIKNGRLAMIAITAFAFQELVSQSGVVDATPIFFRPLAESLHMMANSGYIQ
jgi:hypothetical protein